MGILSPGTSTPLRKISLLGLRTNSLQGEGRGGGGGLVPRDWSDQDKVYAAESHGDSAAFGHVSLRM